MIEVLELYFICGFNQEMYSLLNEVKKELYFGFTLEMSYLFPAHVLQDSVLCKEDFLIAFIKSC